MTQGDKELLLKDLCARLHYEVKVEIDGYNIGILKGIDGDIISTDRGINYPLRLVKPYLRPMSSMTKEEIVELQKLNSGLVWTKDILRDEILGVRYLPGAIDWLNSHHFDYRDLIEKGLALEAPEGMY